jgi:hypothetical protein
MLRAPDPLPPSAPGSRINGCTHTSASKSPPFATQDRLLPKPFGATQRLRQCVNCLLSAEHFLGGEKRCPWRTVLGYPSHARQFKTGLGFHVLSSSGRVISEMGISRKPLDRDKGLSFISLLVAGEWMNSATEVSSRVTSALHDRLKLITVYFHLSSGNCSVA